MIPRKLLDAVALLEGAPHPDGCDIYRQDECSCGLQLVLSRLYPIVGASPTEGRVADGHPLRSARLARLAEPAFDYLDNPLYQEFVNELLERAPEHYDGDDAAEAIAIRYVRDLEDALVRICEARLGEDIIVEQIRPFVDVIAAITEASKMLGRELNSLSETVPE